MLSREHRKNILVGKLNQFYYDLDNKYKARNFIIHPMKVEFDDFFKLSLGEPVIKIQSSKFMLVNILKLFNELIEFIRQHSPEQNLRENQKFIKNNNTIAVNMKFFINCQNYNEFEKLSVLEIVKFIKNHNFQKVGNICIENLPLFTQFMVGFLFYLSSFVFEEVTLSVNGDISLKKLLENGIARLDQFAEKLNLQDLDETKTVVSVCDIKLLFERNFNQILVNFNNFLCLKFCSFYLNESI